MATYVLSDVHGEQDRFQKMLEEIRFSDGDTLYILGDVIDRGPDGVALLRQIMDTPNMELLLGNHEYMCLRYHSPQATPEDIRRWGINGNQPTLEALDRLRPKQRDEILFYLETLPTHKRITVAGVTYHLVHGFPGMTTHQEVWGRPEADTPSPYTNCRVIVGHTPVLLLGRDNREQERYAMELYRRGDHLRISHQPGFIDLDCGCGHRVPIRALGCLRLDDMAEFYT